MDYFDVIANTPAPDGSGLVGKALAAAIHNRLFYSGFEVVPLRPKAGHEGIGYKLVFPTETSPEVAHATAPEPTNPT